MQFSTDFMPFRLLSPAGFPEGFTTPDYYH
jgi:hypothetical protein